MTTSTHEATADIPAAIPIEVAAEVAADLTRIGVLHAGHPRFVLASHVAALLGAVARFMLDDSDPALEAERAADTLDHTCHNHLDAAVYIIGQRLRQERLDAVDVVRMIPRVMTDMLDG